MRTLPITRDPRRGLLPHTSADGADVHVDDAEYIRSGTPAPYSPILEMPRPPTRYGIRRVPRGTHDHRRRRPDVAGDCWSGTPPGTPGSRGPSASGVRCPHHRRLDLQHERPDDLPFKAACTDFPLNRTTAAVLADEEYRWPPSPTAPTSPPAPERPCGASRAGRCVVA